VFFCLLVRMYALFLICLLPFVKFVVLFCLKYLNVLTCFSKIILRASTEWFIWLIAAIPLALANPKRFSCEMSVF
jgi:hypothetical protein